MARSFAGAIVGRLGFRVVPLHVCSVAVATGAVAHGVSEAAVKPAGKLSLDASTLPVLKLAALVVVPRDLLKLSTAEAEARTHGDLLRAAVELLDSTFVSDAAAVPGESPAGPLRHHAGGGHLLNGVRITRMGDSVPLQTT